MQDFQIIVDLYSASSPFSQFKASACITNGTRFLTRSSFDHYSIEYSQLFVFLTCIIRAHSSSIQMIWLILRIGAFWIAVQFLIITCKFLQTNFSQPTTIPVPPKNKEIFQDIYVSLDARAIGKCDGQFDLDRQTGGHSVKLHVRA